MRVGLRVGVLVLVGCGGGGGGSESADAGDPADAADPADSGDRIDAGTGALAGEITVLDGGGLGHPWPAPVVFASFPDSTPSWYTEEASAGACRLLRYEPGFCDPPCDGVCVAPGQCEPWPAFRSAGTLTVSGLAAAVAIEPPFDGRYTTFGGLPDPLFAADATITAAASGSTIGAFTVSARSVSRLSVPSLDADGRATLVDGSDLDLTWPDPDASARVRLVAHTGGAPHGTPAAALIDCESADTGSLVVPATLIEAMPALGTGCSKGRDCAKLGIMRFHRANVATDAGDVALVVGSGTNYVVVH